jgi:hypothetical protein
MKAIVNENEYNVYYHLTDITLGKFLDWHKQYGYSLDKALNELTSRDYTDEELQQHLANEALSWYSFWTGCNLIEVRYEPFVLPIIDQYKTFRELLSDVTELLSSYKDGIVWNHDLWFIKDFKNKPEEDITVKECLWQRSVARQVLRSVYHLQKGEKSVLPYLCAVYFRKQHEKLTEELLNERVEIMKGLSMDIVKVIEQLIIESVVDAETRIRTNNIDFHVE